VSTRLVTSTETNGPPTQLLDLGDGVLAGAVEQVGHDDGRALLGEALQWPVRVVATRR
jgi:hypothetical protein